MKQSIIKYLIPVALFMILPFTGASAAPGTLSRTPVLTSANVLHNILFMLDNSGSMATLVQEAPYDPNVNYGNCPSANIISNGLYITSPTVFKIISGKPYFPSTTGNLPWGLGANQKCFNRTINYTANLDTNGDISSGTLSGNYLNYYFNSSNDPTWTTRKPSVRNRIEVLKDVTTQIVESLQSVRVGIAKFHTVMVGIDDIQKNRAALLAGIDSITASGGTPLAATLHELARYFRGSSADTLILHPGKTNQTTKAALTVFNKEPDYASGVSKVSPIQSYCQQNYMIIVTDGDPSGDTNFNSGGNPTGLANYAGTGGSSSLDDIANAIYDMDLLPAMNDSANQPVKNNIVTYTVGFSLDNQLLKDTAALGGGLYFTANDTTQLLQSLLNITANIQARTATAAGIAINALSLGVNSGFFQTFYIGGDWTGDLKKVALAKDGTAGSTLWNAATIVNAMTVSSRFIFTYNRDAKLPKLFTDGTQLSTAQQNDLKTAPNGSMDGLMQDRINYLRGDRTKEGSPFRVRKSLMGDLINSTPVYSGVAESKWPDVSPFPTGAQAYSTFVAKVANRTPAVYVNNNNPGSLQSYNADTGALLMEYIPEILFSSNAQEGLHYLTDPAYAHRYYADGPAVAQDAYMNGDWRTVLMSGLNAGGKGYYALNITDPSKFLPGNIGDIFMWEFSNKDDADMGFSYGKPIIGMLNNGRFAAIIPNGFNNTGSGTAAVYILFLDGGTDGIWTLGTDYLKFDTKVGSSTNLNGSASIAAIDLDGDGTIDRVYMADILGNIWPIDLSSSSMSNWKFAYGTSSAPAPLIAMGKPITGGMQIVKNPKVTATSANAPNVLILFGTGQMLVTADKTDTQAQYFASVWDAGKSSLTIANLMNQAYDPTTNTTKRVLGNATVPYIASTPKYGCYIDLPTSGERVITDPLLVGNTVVFTTVIPQGLQMCVASGSGWLVAANIDNCGEPIKAIFDVNNDNKIDETDKLNGHVVSGILFSTGMPLQPVYRSEYLFTPLNDGTLSKIKVLIEAGKTGRLSWQDLGTSDPSLTP